MKIMINLSAKGQRRIIAKILPVVVLVSFLSVSFEAYSQDEYIEIKTNKPKNNGSGGNKGTGSNGAGGRNVTGGKNNTGGRTTSVAPKITFDKAAKTLNCEGWEYQFVVVDGSKFMMGSVPGNPEESAMGSRAHKVNLETFAIGNFEVPRWLWKAVMGTDPFKTGVVEEDDMGAPVNNVSWNDCNTFITKLNKLTGMTFALPTEAQWEYAARGGVNNDKYIYSGTNDETKLPAVANSLGIYSMSGLLKEWCSDWYSDWNTDENFTEACVLNPKGSDSGHIKVVRGGSNDDYEMMKVTARDAYSPSERSGNIGLRLVWQMVK